MSTGLASAVILLEESGSKIGQLAKESVRNIDKKLYIIAASSGVHLSIEEETSSTMIRAASIRSFSL